MRAKRQDLFSGDIDGGGGDGRVGQTVGPVVGGKTPPSRISPAYGLTRRCPASSRRLGPGPVKNRSRRQRREQLDQLVGDYTNPILKPGAAEIVKKARRDFDVRHDLSDPGQPVLARTVPFIFWNFGMQMLQQPDKITML